jgi:2-polyprenyl-6-methoxyphenol hydroxylase-like FAD-dependent oxidoreductase
MQFSNRCRRTKRRQIRITMESANVRKTQVIIAGAGPTGLSLAAQLIRYGIDFILIERNAHTTPLSKALVVQARSLEIFQELGIADEAIRRGKLTTALRLYYKGKQRISIDFSDLGAGLSDFPFALSLEQSKTETLFIDYLTLHDKQVAWSSELTGFEEDEQGITAHYTNAQGVSQTIQAAYLVGCDGASSLVRHHLNLGFQGSTEPKLFYVADVTLTSPVINENVLYMYMIRKGFALFFPMEGDGHYRIVGIIPAARDNDREYAFSDVQGMILQSVGSPLDFREVRWFSTYKVHSRMADAFRKGRCFIAGDAAHIHTPAGGQGMNTGIQDAYNLAWKLAYSLRGEVSEEVLGSYHTERSANARHLLNTTDRMFDLMSGRNRFWNFIRLRFFPTFLRFVSRSRLVKRRIFPLLSQTGIAYPDSYLTMKSAIGNVKAGDRMHYFVFSNGESIFRYLKKPVFKLLYFGTNKAATLVTSIPEVVQLTFREIPTSLFGSASEFYILLRPDNHIMYIGKELGCCKEMMDRIKAKPKM